MNKKLIIISSIIFAFMVVVGFVYYGDPLFKPFGNSTTFKDSTNYITINKSVYIFDSLKVGKDIYGGVKSGKYYLDTSRSGQIYFTGLSMYLSNTKSKGYMYFSTNQAFNFEQDISGSLVDIATLDTNGYEQKAGYIKFKSMSSTLRDAISPAAGMVIYNSTTNKLQCYGGGVWNDLY